MEEQTPSEASGEKRFPALRIQVINGVLVSVGAVLALVAVVALIWLFDARARSDEMHRRHYDCIVATNDLMAASDYLTTKSRMYVVTGDARYLEDYLTEFLKTRRRDHAVATLRAESEDGAIFELSSALDESNELADREFYAMRLIADATGLSPLPSKISEVSVDEADDALDRDGKFELAQEMLLGYEYEGMKSLIVTDVDDCTERLMETLKASEATSERHERDLHIVLLVIAITDLALLAIAGIVNYLLVMRPMQRHAQNIQANEPLDMIGSRELRYVCTSYNRIYEENLRRTMLLRHEAETDALTGLLNRGSFDRLLERHAKDIALVLFDVDLFKEINDTYGHVLGDEVLRRVGGAIKSRFRVTDYPCRIGGDEFAVILTEMSTEMRGVVQEKIEQISVEVAVASGDIPPVTLSVGVAFSVTVGGGMSIYRAADQALYEAKRRGRARHVFFEQSWVE